MDTKSGITQADGAGTVTFKDNVTVGAGDTGSSFEGDVAFEGLTLFKSSVDVTFGSDGTDTLTISTNVPVTIDTSSGNADVTVNSKVFIPYDLTIESGGGNITLNGSLDGNKN